jgi:nucleoside-diphosphate-sugar epimerase
MRLLIIGASGYLGAHVRNRARAAGMDVVTASRSGQHRLDLADGPQRVATVIEALAPDAVVNCAGATSGPHLVAANLHGTHALAEAMLRTRPGRLVHLGSAAEYGPAEEPVSERTPPRPASRYGVTKLAGTRLVELAAAAGLDAVVLRVFNPVGPGAPPTSLPGRLAAELRAAMRHGTDVRLGSLDAVRDFVDARDVADAVIAAVGAVALPHTVVNIGAGRGVPVRSVAKQLVAISGYQGPVVENTVADHTVADNTVAENPVQDAAGRSADVSWQQADITRAAQDLGWTPHRELTTSLTDLWEASR